MKIRIMKFVTIVAQCCSLTISTIVDGSISTSGNKLFYFYFTSVVRLHSYELGSSTQQAMFRISKKIEDKLF